jgi:hypothetical protein
MAAGENREVARPRASLKRVYQLPLVVPNHYVLNGLYADFRETQGGPCAIGIEYLAEATGNHGIGGVRYFGWIC